MSEEKPKSLQQWEQQTGRTGSPGGGLLGRLNPYAASGGASLFPLAVLFGLNAADQLDRQAFAILAPDIRESFALSIGAILAIHAAMGVLVLLLEIPLAHLADRFSRVKLAIAGAIGWSGFSVLSGASPTVPLMAVTRAGAGLSRATSGATHNSLLADYYTMEGRPAAYSLHQAGHSAGVLIGPFAAGAIAYFLGWRWPFILLAIPTALIVVLAFRLKEPIRGAHERRAAGASEEVVGTEEAPAAMSEAFRIIWQVATARRIYVALPIVGILLLGMGPFLQIFYQLEFELNEIQRGTLSSIAEPFQLVGFLVAIPVGMRLLRRDPGLLMVFAAGLAGVGALSVLGMALAQQLWLAVVMQAALAATRAALAPTLFTTFSLVLPPRVRSLGFSFANVFMMVAMGAEWFAGGRADAWGVRPGLAVLAPALLVGGFLLYTARGSVSSDMHRVRTSAVAMAEVRAARNRGEVKLLHVKDLDVAYGDVQVLFGVNFEIGEGEVVALLGTNGAGKSTLLKAVSGIVEARGGAIVFDGRDMTFAPPEEVARVGMIQVPAKEVFPTLTVVENLRIAGWLNRRDPKYVREAMERVRELFPSLDARWDQPAGNLSGGEQQMLTLSMAFIGRPRLLMIDELSLGLAPTIVEQLLEVVRAMQEQGTTIILVEQSVNVALSIADTAYFMEKGEIRFKGPTAELLDRPDILRSVFLEGASVSAASEEPVEKAPTTARAARATDRTERDAPEEKRPILQVRDISKSYGGVRAVNGVSFDLHENEIVGIIGPNGAGKTTVFDLVTGFVPTDTGEVVFAGEDITLLPPDLRSRAGLGRSFQDAKLFPGLTVWETIAMALSRKVKSKDPVAAALSLPGVRASERDIAKRVDELIELMGLSAFRDKFISELSTGSRRIVDLAGVLAHEPKAILFDEPSSGIAQREAEALGPLLLRIRDATSSSMLVIEHDMPLITSVSDEMLALDLGQVVTRGTPAEVVNHPQVVSSYLGTREDIIARSGARATGGEASDEAETEPPSRRKRRAAPTNGAKKTGRGGKKAVRTTSARKAARTKPKKGSGNGAKTTRAKATPAKRSSGRTER